MAAHCSPKKIHKLASRQHDTPVPAVTDEFDIPAVPRASVPPIIVQSNATSFLVRISARDNSRKNAYL
jgi:hypothetical protein